MIKYIVLLTSILLLSGCGSTSKETKLQDVNFGNFNIMISSNYTITNIKPNQKIKNTDILLEYKFTNYNNLSPSLVIYKYNGEYPNNISKFSSIILDKFQKNVMGGNIINNESLNIDKNKLFYFTYSISNNIFSKEEKTDYFGLQAYLFGKDKQIYIISYIGKTKEQLDNIISDIKNLKYNK